MAIGREFILETFIQQQHKTGHVHFKFVQKIHEKTLPDWNVFMVLWETNGTKMKYMYCTISRTTHRECSIYLVITPSMYKGGILWKRRLLQNYKIIWILWKAMNGLSLYISHIEIINTR